MEDNHITLKIEVETKASETTDLFLAVLRDISVRIPHVKFTVIAEDTYTKERLGNLTLDNRKK